MRQICDDWKTFYCRYRIFYTKMVSRLPSDEKQNVRRDGEENEICWSHEEICGEHDRFLPYLEKQDTTLYGYTVYKDELDDCEFG